MRYSVSSEVSRIRRKSFLRYQLPFWLCVAGIFTLSSIPSSSIPSVKLPLPADKVAHFVEFGILGFMLLRALLASGKISTKRAAMIVILTAAVLGAADEAYQIPTERDSSIYDWMADCLGATASLSLLPIYKKLKESMQAKKSP